MIYDFLARFCEANNYNHDACILTRLIFTEINFRMDLFLQMSKSKFCVGFIFVDDSVSVILDRLIFMVDKIFI